MDNLIFSLNATIPVFLMMVLGMIFRKIGLFDEAFITKMNKFVFVVALPALLFEDIGSANFYEAWDTTYVLYCFGATLLSILISFFISIPLRKNVSQGEFVQAAYRSSAAIIGMAFVQNIYGDYGMASLMIIRNQTYSPEAPARPPAVRRDGLPDPGSGRGGQSGHRSPCPDNHRAQ